MSHILTAILCALLGFGAAWQWQDNRITQTELSHADERIALQRAARATIERLTTQAAQATAAATTRAATLRVAADGARDAGTGLRLTTAATVRATADHPDAGAHAATALATVFDQCAGELQAMAEVADRHANDVQTLTEAWPQ